MAIKNKYPLVINYDANDNVSGLAEVQLATSDASDIGGDTPSEGQVLTYVSADGVYQPRTPTGGGGGGAVDSVNGQTGDVSLYLSGLSGVDTSDLQTDHHIVYDADSTSWISQYSQKLFLIASNQTGGNLSKGAVVYVSGATPGADPAIALALANSSATMPSIGVIYETIPNTSSGPVITFGTALGLTFDDALDSGDIGKTVYVSPTNAGQVTVTKPTGSTNLIQNVGILVDDSPVKVKVTGVGRANDIPVNVDVVGSATIGTNNIFTQTDAQLAGTTASELVLTDSSNKISSVASSVLIANANLQDLKDVDGVTVSGPARDGKIVQFRGTGQGAEWELVTVAEATDYDAALAEGEDVGPTQIHHGILSGLGDDDHTQYVLSAGTREMATLTVTGEANFSGTLNVQPSGWDQMSGSPVPVVYYRKVGYPIASSNTNAAEPGDELVAITIPANTLTYYEVDIMCRGRVKPDGHNIILTTELDGNRVLRGGAGAGAGTGYGLAMYEWQVIWTKHATDEQAIFMNWIQSGDVSSFVAGGGVGGLNSRQTHGVIWNQTSHTESSSAEISLNFRQSAANNGYFTIDSLVVTFIPLHAMNTS